MEILRKYDVATTIVFPMVQAGAQDFANTGDWTPVAADCQISKDEIAFVNTGSLVVAEGQGHWSLALTNTEMQAARIMIGIVDAVTKAVEDQSIIITTYGNASAAHAFDLDLAQQLVTVASMNANVLNAAAINAAALNGKGDWNIGKTGYSINAIVADTITAAAIAAAALDGKGDWNIGKTGYSLTQAFPTNFADLLISATTGLVEIAPLFSGTSEAGGSVTTMVDTGRTELDDVFNGSLILFTSGAVNGQCRVITDFVAATDTITFAPAVTAAIGAGFTYEILPMADPAFARLITQPGQLLPPASELYTNIMGYFWKTWRNRITSTNSQMNLFNDDATTVDQKWPHSDDATTFDKTEVASGP